MLENDTERYTRIAAERYQIGRFPRVAGDRLFEKNVFAGSCKRTDDIGAGIGRRCDDGEIDIAVTRGFLD